MTGCKHLPLPRLDALLLGAHRAIGEDGDEPQNVPVLTDEALFRAVGVRIGFTGREGGVSEGPYASLNCADHVEDDPDAVARNRQILLEALGVPGVPLVMPTQVHGTNIVCVGEAFSASGAVAEGESALSAQASCGFGGNGSATSASADGGMGAVFKAQRLAEAGADGLVVPVPGVAALLTFADCLPLVLVAPGGTFAVAHAGWRGAVAHVARLAAEALAHATGEEPSQFNAYIGPHIRSECFEVGPEVAGAFAGEFGDGVLAGRDHVSLATAVSCDLLRAGLDPRRIADAGICTQCHPDEYFSYRASGGRCGRHAAIAVRIP